MIPEALAALIVKERSEIENAPIVYTGAPTLRCHLCGQMTDGGTRIEVVEGVERWKGFCCGG